MNKTETKIHMQTDLKGFNLGIKATRNLSFVLLLNYKSFHSFIVKDARLLGRQ